MVIVINARNVKRFIVRIVKIFSMRNAPRFVGMSMSISFLVRKYRRIQILVQGGDYWGKISFYNLYII